MWRVRREINCDDKIHKEYTGKNISVAILDTGIFLHPDLNHEKIVFKDFVNQKTKPYDDSGHGTHVAGCLCGSGRLSGGKLRGVAPAVNLIVGKVLNKNGTGKIENMIQGVTWILEKEREYNIRILNISMSFDKSISREKVGRLLTLLEKIQERGIITVVAAGNHGPRVNSISPLGMVKEVLCVGCHDKDYRNKEVALCETYSGRGPGIFNIRKPDIVAPGTGITSLCCPDLLKDYSTKSYYISRSGTSFATPLVSGAIALLLEKQPDLQSEEIKRRVCYTATDLREPWNKQGWGMINVRRLLDYS